MFGSRHRHAVASLLLTAGAACSDALPPEHRGGERLWSVPGASHAAPAIADSTVYFSGDRHEVVALDAATGRLRWRATTDATSPESVYGRNVIVVGSLVVVPDAAVFAFDRVTGERRWRFLPANGDIPGPTIATDGTRVFAASPGGFVYALSVASGAVVWANELAADDNTVIAHPVVDRDQVVVALRHWTNPTSGGVVALDASTGAVRWRRDFHPGAPGRGSGSDVRAAVWRDLVIATSDDGVVYALRRTDGSIAWTAPRLAELVGGYNDHRPVSVVGDVVAVGSDVPILVGLDAATGAERWRLHSAFGTVNYEMGSDDRYIYLVYVGLQLSAIEAATGRIAWTSGGVGDAWYAQHPVSDGVRVYSPGGQGLYALRR